MADLEVEDLDVYYGDAQALREVSLEVHEGEIVSVIGPNGAGKTTLIETIIGINQASSGRIRLDGVTISDLPAHEINAHDIALVPEDRRLFPHMTVKENLEIGAYRNKARQRRHKTFEEVYEMFPVLREREKQKAGTLSGGEQQMVSIGRALMALPDFLLMDEPSLGLQPSLVDLVFEKVRQINDRGMTVLIVEQNVKQTLEVSKRGYVLEDGRIVKSDEADSLLTDPEITEAYLAF